MENIFVKATKLQEEKLIEIWCYSDLYSDIRRGHIDKKCLYDYKEYKNYVDLVVGCYFVRIIPRTECKLSLDYDKGKLTILMDGKEFHVGDFKRNFLIDFIETDKVRIEIEFY